MLSHVVASLLALQLRPVPQAASQTDAGKRPATATKVNAWTEWGTLRAVVVGHAWDACFPPMQPGFKPVANHEGGASHLAEGEPMSSIVETSGAGAVIAEEVGWPLGPKKASTIAAANAQLDNLARVLAERGVEVSRPDRMDWTKPLSTPHFDVPNQYCTTCPRDVVATLGSIVLEATMSRRDRYFEVNSLRSHLRSLWRADKRMQWKSAPKPTMGDDMYKPSWWDLTTDERYARMHDYDFCITEEEPIFDAADIMRCGKDLFVQLSMTCNQAGIDWLTRELEPQGFRVHRVRFPYDLAPSHLDCTFVPLKPGLVLTNPERPILEEDAAIFRANGWRFIDAPQPDNPTRPWASQSSKWLSMNVLSISPTCVVAEEQETSLHALLESEGFEVIKVPFRAVYEFGGGLHCATWDTLRDDDMDDFFPAAYEAADAEPPVNPEPAATEVAARLRGGVAAAPEKPKAAEEKKGWWKGLWKDTKAEETGYSGLRSREDRSEWSAIKEELDETRLDIDGHPVMQRWETPYMGSLAAVATSKGGRVLEVGFGMGISASAIQAVDAVDEHLIIEANADVYARLEAFAASSRRPVTPIGPALWQDALDTVEDGSLDGILYDTYPLNKEEQHTHQFEFLKRARQKLKKGGVLTYCNLTSLGVLKGKYDRWEDLFRETQLPKLLEAGWLPEEISFTTAPTAPPVDCEYYSHDTGLVPILTKQ